MGHVGSLAENLTFLSPLGTAENKFNSKPFHSTLNYASIVNIQEVMYFYNLGETDFRRSDVQQHFIVKSCNYILVCMVHTNFLCIGQPLLNFSVHHIHELQYNMVEFHWLMLKPSVAA